MGGESVAIIYQGCKLTYQQFQKICKQYDIDQQYFIEKSEKLTIGPDFKLLRCVNEDSVLSKVEFFLYFNTMLAGEDETICIDDSMMTEDDEEYLLFFKWIQNLDLKCNRIKRAKRILKTCLLPVLIPTVLEYFSSCQKPLKIGQYLRVVTY